jgi:mercuric ion transport protein
MPAAVLTRTPPRGSPALWLAGFAALLASSCCLLPLVLVLIGISGTWIAQLTLLRPFSPWLEALALAALGLAAWRIYGPGVRSIAGAAASSQAACDGDPAALCAATRPALRAWFWMVALLTVLPLATTLLAPLFY